MEDAIAEQVRTVLAQRLSQLNLEGAQIDFPEDRQTVVVTLPADAETDGVAEFLAWQNALEFTDADGKVWLTGADVSESSVGFAEDGTPYIQISFTEEGGQTFAEALEASDALDVTMDGEQIAQVTAEDAGESGSCTATGSFTEDEARLFVARIAAGELPVALTLTGTSTGETILILPGRNSLLSLKCRQTRPSRISRGTGRRTRSIPRWKWACSTV